LFAIASIIVAMLFFFEWLGSEQPQHWVEIPVAASPNKGNAATRK
jgi:hypothetical protein